MLGAGPPGTGGVGLDALDPGVLGAVVLVGAELVGPLLGVGAELVGALLDVGAELVGAPLEVGAELVGPLLGVGAELVGALLGGRVGVALEGAGVGTTTGATVKDLRAPTLCQRPETLRHDQ